MNYFVLPALALALSDVKVFVQEEEAAFLSIDRPYVFLQSFSNKNSPWKRMREKRKLALLASDTSLVNGTHSEYIMKYCSIILAFIELLSDHFPI